MHGLQKVNDSAKKTKIFPRLKTVVGQGKAEKVRRVRAWGMDCKNNSALGIKNASLIRRSEILKGKPDGKVN